MASLPREIVVCVLSYVKDAKTLGCARQVCATWRDACEQIVWRDAEAADAYVAQKEWSIASLHYEDILARRPLFIPALLSLQYVLKWTGNQWNRERELVMRARRAGDAPWREAGRFLEREAGASPHRWFVRGLSAACRGRACLDWYHRAAEAGHAGAQCELAATVLKCRGVASDLGPCAAFQWFSRSAAQDYPPGVYEVGACFYRGIGVVRAAAQAVPWFTKAARLGNYWAQIYLAACYEKGVGMPADALQAAYWRERAEQQEG